MGDVFGDGADETSGRMPPEDAIEQASKRFLDGQLEEAAELVGYALSFEPDKASWHGFLETLLEASPDPVALAPLRDGIPYPTAALRAWILWREGRHAEGVGLLLEVLSLCPDAGYHHWLLRWLGSKGRLDDFPCQAFAVFLNLWMEDCGRHAQSAGWLDRMRAWVLPLLEEIASHQPLDALCLVAGSRVLRALSEDGSALLWAERACQLAPSWRTHVTRAIAHRVRGELELAVEAYEAALEYQPDDLAVRLDLADMFCAAERFDEGLARYEEVLQREPGHAVGEPSFYYGQWLRDGGEGWAHKLKVLAEAQPDNDRARDLYGRVRESLEMFRSWLPEPEDACLTALARQPEGASEVELPAPWAPSAALACRLQRQGRGVFEAAQNGEVRGLWKLVAGQWQPVLPPPPSALLEAIADLAAEPFHMEAWWSYAGHLAAKLGPDAAEQLQAVMLHPPSLPEDRSATDWLQRIELAACLAIARLEESWEGSRRRTILLELLCADPPDWTGRAAIVVLGHLAGKHSGAVHDIVDAFRQQLQATSKLRPHCLTLPLLCCSLWLPELPEGLRQSLHTLKRRLMRSRGHG